MNSFTEPPLEREAFRQALLAASDSWKFEDTRLYHLLDSGRCPPSVILRYARSTYLSAKMFCATVAEFVERAPDGHARLVLLENLLEEEGMVIRRDRGIVTRADQAHPALALRFLRACGGDATDIEDDGLHATAPGRQLLKDGHWVEAIANLLIGQELRFSTVSAQLRDLLLRYGFAERDLAFFSVHVQGDLKHGQEALDLVLDRATGLAQQRRCIDAVFDGSRLWFEMHGSSARHRRLAIAE